LFAGYEEDNESLLRKFVMDFVIVGLSIEAPTIQESFPFTPHQSLQRNKSREKTVARIVIEIRNQQLPGLDDLDTTS